MNKRQTTPRSIATRARLIAVAERLYAERGVDGVSLSEINKASGQRNANACQYHFGGRDGLIQAIVDKHVPWIAARRAEMLDRLEEEGDLELPGLLDAWVTPVAEKLEDPDGGSAFIQVNAQLTDRHLLAYLHPSRSVLRTPGTRRLVSGMNSVLSHVPEPVRQQRLHLASILLFRGLAEHSRLQEDVADYAQDHPTGFLVMILKDAMSAMLSQPVSPDHARPTVGQG